MNLYQYLTKKTANDMTRAAVMAEEAYGRFQKYVSINDCDPFAFAFVDHGYQAFTFKPDQVVKSVKSGCLAIVAGWREVGAGWHVRAKTAEGEFDFDAEGLELAEFPEGLVEIMKREKLHGNKDNML